MVVPSNFTDMLNARNKTEILTFVSNTWTQIQRDEILKRDLRQRDEVLKQDLLKLVIVRSESGETQMGNLTNWSVSDATSKEIKIDLEFDQPLHVSQGDEPD